MQEYTLKLNEHDLNVIAAALDEAPLPRKLSNPLFIKINQQVLEQRQPAPEASPPASE